MTNGHIWRPALVALVVGLESASASAGSATQTYVDVQAGLGYSSNPLLALGDGTDSGFGRLSVYGYHGWSSERSTSSVSAYVENNSYLQHYSNKQAFSLAASTSHQTTEALRLFGDVGFSGDFAGQLTSRFFGVPSGSVPTTTNLPPAAGVVAIDPALLISSQRQYRLTGDVGAGYTLSARETLNASVGVQRVTIGGGLSSLNYTNFDSTLSYDRQINERVTVGGRLIGQYAVFSAGRSNLSFGPQATVQARLGPNVVATAAVGFVSIRQHQSAGLSNSSINLALDGSLCRNLPNERLCAHVARSTQSAVIGGSPTSTSASVEYYRRLTAKDQLQLSATAVRSAALAALGLNQRTSFFTVAASYDRRLSDRLSTGVNAAVRKVTAIAPSPKAGYDGSIFLRYRLGAIR